VDTLLQQDREQFRRVFRDGKRLRARPERDLLEEARLVDRKGRPLVRVFPFHGHLIATDRLDYRDEDQVFSLMFEQHYLARNSSLHEGDDVLELCSGSGAISITAAERARAVTGVDLNPRALAFAEFNRALNAPDRAIEFRQGSLYEPLEEGRRFDLILVNPPFEYVPAGETWFLHSDGGADGLRVARACLEGAPSRLADGGRFEIITYSPGGESGPALLELLAFTFPGSDIDCHILDVDPIENHLRVVDREPTSRRGSRLSRRQVDAWRRELEAQGHTHNYFVFCRVAKGAGVLTLTKPDEEIEECWRLSE
jgi:SAM-dependent methyltransferase